MSRAAVLLISAAIPIVGSFFAGAYSVKYYADSHPGSPKPAGWPISVTDKYGEVPAIMLLSNPDDPLLIYANKWPLPQGTWIVKCDDNSTGQCDALVKEATELSDKCHCPMFYRWAK